MKKDRKRPRSSSPMEVALKIAAIPLLVAIIGLFPWIQTQIHPLSGLSYTYHLTADGVVIEVRNNGSRTLRKVEIILEKKATYVNGDAHNGMELDRVLRCSSTNGSPQQLLVDPTTEFSKFCAHLAAILPGGMVEFHLKTSHTGNLLSDDDLFIHHNDRIKHAMVGSFKNAPFRTFLGIRWEFLHTALTIAMVAVVSVLIVRLIRKRLL